jgi:hypothetical protein
MHLLLTITLQVPRSAELCIDVEQGVTLREDTIDACKRILRLNALALTEQ